MNPGSRSRLSPNPELPLSRPVDVDSVPETGLEIEITASDEERAAIAAESGLPAIGRLTADLVVERRGGGRYEVMGTLAARITQTCVVSLEPFESDVDQEIEITFAPAPSAPRAERASRRAVEGRPTRMAPPPPPAGEDEPPDPIVDGIIDLGAVTVEFLMLARDLYPRKPGAAFTDVSIGEDETPEPSAFAALQRLKDRS